MRTSLTRAVQMKRPVVVALCLAALVCPAAAQPRDVPLPNDEVRSLTAEAAKVRRSLYSEVGAEQPLQGDFVNVTVFGGFPPPDRFTIYLTASASGLRAEIVTQDRVFTGEPPPPHRSTFVVDPDAARKIRAQLASPAIWNEAEGRGASYTDQPVVALDIRWGGRRRHAVSLALGCSPSDLTHRLIDTTLSLAKRR